MSDFPNPACLKFLLVLCCFLGVTPGVAQTSWAKHSQNPVLRRDTVLANMPNDLIANSDCWVQKDNGLYKMWYTCGGLNYPTDTELRSRICYATSSDGVAWTKYSGNPVLDVSYGGGWDSLGVETATVIVDASAPDGQRYKMWYAGQYFNEYRYDIGYAFSPDGIHWTKHPDPVLQVGASSKWDNGFLEGPSVIKENGIYKMWYCGYDAVVDNNGTDGKANIGYATSADGITWVKHSTNPVLATGQGAWDSVYVQDPHVILDNGTYYMWYGGSDVDAYGQKVGFATSSDGVHWVKFGANPVLSTGNPGEWDANTASFPSVLKENDAYRMWYTGKDVAELTPGSLDYFWEIGYAVSLLSKTEVSAAPVFQIRFEPNPASTRILIAANRAGSRSDIRVFDITGKLKYSGKVNRWLDISEFSPGVYIVKNNLNQVYGKFTKL